MRAPIARLFSILLVSLLIVIALIASPALAADDMATITTSGTSTVYATPDKVVISVGITTMDKDIDKAESNNEADAAKVLTAVKALGVAEDAIATDLLTIGPRTHYDSATQIDIQDGFIANRNFAITLKDLTLIEKVVRAVIQDGGNRTVSVDLQCSDLRTYKDQAREMAIIAARENAVALAAALNCSVGKPHTITESEDVPVSIYGRMSNSNSAAVAPASDATQQTIPLGKIAVQASVSVTFELK